MRRAIITLVTGALSVGMCAATRPASAARVDETVPKSYVATLNGPSGVAIDGKDRIVIADTGNDRVILLDKRFEPLGVIEGRSKGGRLKAPRGVATDAQNRIYVADTGNHCVKVYKEFRGEHGYYDFTIGT
ncbi:MAG: hypothetical protein ACTSYK_01915, partial [Alphaproteobacteria bacterium]